MDRKKTKEQLLSEIKELRRRNDELEKLEIEHKQANEALRESEEKYRGIFDESVAAVYVFDTEKNFMDSNQSGLELLGYSREELLSMSIPDVDAAPTVVLPAHKQLLSGEKIVNYEHQLKRKDGRIITVLNNSRPLTDAQGNVVGMQSTLIDITERKKAEERTRQLLKNIRELSAPVLSLWEGILAIPLIGMLDSRRTQDVMEKALTRMAEEKARALIVDITGVPVIDTMVANHLIRMAKAVRLMGGDSILTGISPATALTIVNLGVDLSNIHTRATLEQGLRLAMELVKAGRNL